MKNLREKIKMCYIIIKGILEIIICWFVHRTIKKYHVLNTKLEPGYHDINTIMLHANFALLVRFVEDECAWMYYGSSWDKRKFTKKERFFTNKLTWIFNPYKRKWGLKYLSFTQMDLFHAKQAGLDDRYDEMETSNKIKELYIWWKDVFLKREDPMKISGYFDFWDEMVLSNKHTDEYVHSKEEALTYHHLQSECIRIEEEFYVEEQEMLIRLINLRRQLWT